MAVVISTTVVNGVTLSADYGHTNPVTVTSTGLLIESGAYQAALLGQPTNPWTITNQGTIVATGTASSNGIQLLAGGSVNNSGLVDATGVGVYNSTNLTNSGTIVGDAFGLSGSGTTGTLSNTGQILGGSGLRSAFTQVTNSGTIIGTAGYGVRLFGTASALVTNTGTIAGQSLSAISFDTFNPSGTVVNGTSLTTNGLISGASDGIFFSQAGTVINFGTIASTQPGYGSAIFISGSGLVLNGDATATGRFIGSGYNAIVIAGGGTVSNLALSRQ